MDPQLINLEDPEDVAEEIVTLDPVQLEEQVHKVETAELLHQAQD